MEISAWKLFFFNLDLHLYLEFYFMFIFTLMTRRKGTCSQYSLEQLKYCFIGLKSNICTNNIYDTNIFDFSKRFIKWSFNCCKYMIYFELRFFFLHCWQNFFGNYILLVKELTVTDIVVYFILCYNTRCGTKCNYIIIFFIYTSSNKKLCNNLICGEHMRIFKNYLSLYTACLDNQSDVTCHLKQESPKFSP